MQTRFNFSIPDKIFSSGVNFEAIISLNAQGRLQDFGSGWEHFKGVGFVGGPGAEPLGRRRTFEILQKKSSENCKKIII